MPDTQQMLDRGYSTAQIRTMHSSFRSLAPRSRVGQTCASLLARTPVLDACNHPR